MKSKFYFGLAYILLKLRFWFEKMVIRTECWVKLAVLRGVAKSKLPPADKLKLMAELPKPLFNNTITVEVCERQMDSWIDEACNRRPKYHAQIKDQPGYWSCGKSPEDAIGDLITMHQKKFNVLVKRLPASPR